MHIFSHTIEEQMDAIYTDKLLGAVEHQLKVRRFQKQKAIQRMIEHAEDKAIAKQNAVEQIILMPQASSKKISPLRVKRPI